MPVQPPRHRGIYLLPNLFTTAAMFAGFYAIISSIGGHYVEAALADIDGYVDACAAEVADTEPAALLGR